MRVELENEEPTRLERIVEKSCQSKAGAGVDRLEVCECAGDADDGRVGLRLIRALEDITRLEAESREAELRCPLVRERDPRPREVDAEPLTDRAAPTELDEQPPVAGPDFQHARVLGEPVDEEVRLGRASREHARPVGLERPAVGEGLLKAFVGCRQLLELTHPRPPGSPPGRRYSAGHRVAPRSCERT